MIRSTARYKTELRTMSNPDLAGSVALSPTGSMVAVGLRNGAVRLTSPEARDDGVGGEQDVYLEATTVGEGEYSGSPMAHTLCFSHDGSQLAVGRFLLDDFTVYVTYPPIVKPGPDAMYALDLTISDENQPLLLNDPVFVSYLCGTPAHLSVAARSSKVAAVEELRLVASKV